MKFSVGDTLPPYLIQEVLGAGGMGAVYRAVNQKTSQSVALKVMFDEASAHRFRLETEALASLRHPGIPKIYEVAEEPCFWYAQEIIEGPSLESRLAEGVAQGEGIWMVLGLLDILEAVHNHGGVHRDVNPNNLLLRRGQICLIDFGIVRIMEKGAGLTTSGEVLGTPQYMAPEQIDRGFGEICPATDLFATATILYRMLTGRLPTDPGSYPRILRQVVTKVPDPPEGVSEALSRVVMKGLEKNVSDRYATARQFADQLQAAAR